MSGAVLPVFRLGSAAGERRLARLVGRAATVFDRATQRAAERLVREVRRGGDAALLAAVERFDGVAVTGPESLRLPLDPVAVADLPRGFAAALEVAIAAVEDFHRPQVRGGYLLERQGVTLEERLTPLDRVGLYVPGGRASYPSTVVMSVIPARLAGVRELVIATPPAGFTNRLALRYTLRRLGLGEVWGMGGAHAVAALAYGTETVPRVDKIAGPGNAWVSAAKRVVAGDVGIDGVAGPSEVVILASAGCDPAWVAADLLAQAEHDPLAAAVMVTTDLTLARAVAAEVAAQLPELTTATTAAAALARFGGVLLAQNLEAALAVVERLAPEHLQLVGPAAEALAPRVRRAGAVFVGAMTPEVFGDYVAGPSHVLPTCGSARFASSLGVDDFVRRSHCLTYTAAAAREAAPHAAAWALAEGLPAHAAAARRRLNL